MSRPPLLAVAFCALAGCVAPSLDDVESKMPHACDQAHACASGYDCVAGTCRKHTAGQCTPGATQPCGSDAGECRPGTQTCLDDGGMSGCEGGVGPQPERCNGKDDDCNGTIDDFDAGYCERDAGVCASARRHCLNAMVELVCLAEDYGPDFEATETRCDGLDNDCNGQVDEGLTTACPLTKGVCNGSTVACVNGSYPACTVANYGPSYDSFEFRCDAKDNDCDGQVDVSRLLDVSQSGGMAQRPAAVALDTGPLLVLYERLGKVSAQTVAGDGTVSAPQSPAVSVDATNASYLPAVSANGSTVVAAWAEDTSGLQRVMLAALDHTGRSTLPGNAALSLYNTDAGISQVAVAYSPGQGAILTAFVSNGALHLIGVPGDVTGAMLYNQLAAPNNIGRVAVGAGDNSFPIAFEDQSVPGVQHCLVSKTGVVTCGTPVPGAREPVVRMVDSATAEFLQVVSDGGASQLTAQVCDAGGCGPLRAWGLPRSELKSPAPLERASNGASHFAVWEENGSLWFGGEDGGASLALTGGVGGYTPRFVGLDNVTPAWVVVDTGSGVSGVGANEVAVERRCLP